MPGATYTGVGSNVVQSTSPTITEPVDGDNDQASTFTVFARKLADYIALLWAGAFTGQTAASPGLKATAGGGGAPGTGALNLVPQVAPSAPANGDLWTTTAALFARINAATKTLAALETPQTFTAAQTFTGGCIAPSTAKAWALLQCGAAGAVSILGGLNIASASYAASLLTVNFTAAIGSTTYAPVCNFSAVV